MLIMNGRTEEDREGKVTCIVHWAWKMTRRGTGSGHGQNGRRNR